MLRTKIFALANRFATVTIALDDPSILILVDEGDEDGHYFRDKDFLLSHNFAEKKRCFAGTRSLL